jgi:hypothetical protein
MKCDEDAVNGCTRCCMPPSRLCCDIYNPLDFTQYNIPAIPSTHLICCSRLKADFSMSSSDISLRDALLDWRERTTNSRYGYSTLVDYGGTLAMPDEVLDRIIICSHYAIIETKDDLARKTRWDEADRYALEVLKLIEDFKPPPTPLRPIAPKDRAKTKCGACGLTGHNSKLNSVHPLWSLV